VGNNPATTALRCSSCSRIAFRSTCEELGSRTSVLVGGAICKSGYTQRVMRRDAEQPGVETDFLALDSYLTIPLVQRLMSYPEVLPALFLAPSPRSQDRKSRVDCDSHQASSAQLALSGTFYDTMRGHHCKRHTQGKWSGNALSNAGRHISRIVVWPNTDSVHGS